MRGFVGKAIHLFILILNIYNITISRIGYFKRFLEDMEIIKVHKAICKL